LNFVDQIFEQFSLKLPAAEQEIVEIDLSSLGPIIDQLQCEQLIR